MCIGNRGMRCESQWLKYIVGAMDGGDRCV